MWFNPGLRGVRWRAGLDGGFVVSCQLRLSYAWLVEHLGLWDALLKIGLRQKKLATEGAEKKLLDRMTGLALGSLVLLLSRFSGSELL